MTVDVKTCEQIHVLMAAPNEEYKGGYSKADSRTGDYTCIGVKSTS
jgi:hypothetical protein